MSAVANELIEFVYSLTHMPQLMVGVLKFMEQHKLTSPMMDAFVPEIIEGHPIVAAAVMLRNGPPENIEASLSFLRRFPTTAAPQILAVPSFHEALMMPVVKTLTFLLGNAPLPPATALVVLSQARRLAAAAGPDILTPAHAIVILLAYRFNNPAVAYPLLCELSPRVSAIFAGSYTASLLATLSTAVRVALAFDDYPLAARYCALFLTLSPCSRRAPVAPDAGEAVWMTAQILRSLSPAAAAALTAPSLYANSYPARGGGGGGRLDGRRDFDIDAAEAADIQAAIDASLNEPGAGAGAGAAGAGAGLGSSDPALLPLVSLGGDVPRTVTQMSLGQFPPLLAAVAQVHAQAATDANTGYASRGAASTVMAQPVRLSSSARAVLPSLVGAGAGAGAGVRANDAANVLLGLGFSPRAAQRDLAAVPLRALAQTVFQTHAAAPLAMFADGASSGGPVAAVVTAAAAGPAANAGASAANAAVVLARLFSSPAMGCVDSAYVDAATGRLIARLPDAELAAATAGAAAEAVTAAGAAAVTPSAAAVAEALRLTEQLARAERALEAAAAARQRVRLESAEEMAAAGDQVRADSVLLASMGLDAGGMYDIDEPRTRKGAGGRQVI